jgi:hypothetical protein
LKEPGLVDVIHWLEDVFDRQRVRRSYGGAIAYNYYGPARFTEDVDVLVLLPRTAVPALVDALAGGGCTRDPSGPLELPPILADLDGTSRFTALRCFGVRVEIFSVWHPFHRRVLDRSPRRDLEGRRIPIHTAEDLIVFKKVFDRPKDIQDIKAILMAQRGRLDTERIRSEAAELLPAESMEELEQLLAEHA